MFGPSAVTKQRLVQEISALNSHEAGPSIMEYLLKDLPFLELNILRENEDLIDRTRKISKMNENELLDRIREDHHLIAENYNTGDIFIAVDKVLENMPEWVDLSSHLGWFLRLNDGEFAVWARKFLMQEVRINLWIRLMEQKKKKPKKQTHYGVYA